MSTPFFDLPVAEQVLSLERHARKILTEYPIEVLSIECINYEFNLTFKVESRAAAKFALRININSHRTRPNVLAEIAFVKHLCSFSNIHTPTPVAMKNGEFVISLPHADSGRELTSVLYTWLEGEEMGDEPTSDQLFALGATMARMHQATLGFKIPSGSVLPTYSDVLWGEKNLLLDEEILVDADSRQAFKAAFNHLQGELDRLYASGVPQVIHADLHGWNAMIDGSTISVFDFDDSGIGFPIQDLATAIYYLDTEEQDAALKAGYESVAPLPAHTPQLMEILLLQRRLILMNYLYESTNAEHRAMIPDYLTETVRRVNKLLSDSSEVVENV